MTEAVAPNGETMPDRSAVDNILANSDLFDAAEALLELKKSENSEKRPPTKKRQSSPNILANSDLSDHVEASQPSQTEISPGNDLITLYLPPKPIEKKVKVDTVLKQIETDCAKAQDDGGSQQEWTQRVNDIKQYFDEWVANLSEQRKNKLPQMADEDGPEVPEPNEENLNSFELSFGSSHFGEFEVLNGDSLFQNGERIFIYKILANQYIGMKRIPNTDQFAPIEISFNQKTSFEMVRVNLE